MLVTMVMVFMVLMMLVMVMVVIVWGCWVSGSGCEWCAQGECSQYKDRA